MNIPIYQVDAFASRLFTGNPAAVCPLDTWLPDERLQAIAEENNLAETAYFVPSATGFHLRWFTPAVEVDLCGHATLAAAFVIMKHINPQAASARFQSRSGELLVEREGDLYHLDFPAQPPVVGTPDPGLAGALGVTPSEVYLTPRDYFCVLESESAVRKTAPMMERLAATGRPAIITARGEQSDFVSRFFAPGFGINEDPVTGSAHCALIPYWAARLGKTSMRARQLSKRGGELWCELRGDRVRIGGQAVEFLHGAITI